MNDFQRKLHHDLTALVAASADKTFFSKTVSLDNRTYYRIFNYGMFASYTSFLQPGALECRGIMFEIDKDNVPIRLACLPMEKFFNLHENPSTMNLNLAEEVVEIQEKADGSLMSTYIHNNQLRLKSKGSSSFSVRNLDGSPNANESISNSSVVVVGDDET